MLFNSYSFLFLFAPIFYVLYWRARTIDGKKRLSLGASYVFYSIWSIRFAALMLLTTSVDFFTARIIAGAPSPRRRRAWLALSMVVNLGVLATFKYYDFFASSANALFPHPIIPVLHVTLPIGISFYTFESMSYTIDVYRHKTRPLRRFLDYGHFVTMFPRLVAGPIARYADLAAQLRSLPARLGAGAGLEAAHFFTFGLVKKTLIADLLAARLVDPLFARAPTLGAAGAWLAALAYTAQLYFDFSGYSDMAVGLARLMGLDLPRNFALPYGAANPSEFWRRWHISLSTWLRDYLFIPLGGSRGSTTTTARNLLVTMLLGGLWHGANWTFLAWGAYHGIVLAAYNLKVVRAPWLPRHGAIAVNFLFVVMGWVIFRARTIREAGLVLGSMVGRQGLGLGALRSEPLALAVLVLALTLSMTIDTYDVRFPRRPLVAFGLAMLFLGCVMRVAAPSPFLYFQF